MIPFEEALEIALGSVSPLGPARLHLAEAAGLRLAEDAVADTDLPPFDRSAMDGYAVRAADLPEAGCELSLAGEVAAGAAPEFDVGTGECVRIFTGAPVPEGADAVVMQEVTSPGSGEGLVRFAEAVKPGANIARRGEDVRAGDIVLRAGTRLGAAEVSLLAAAGANELAVIPRPRVSILSTGNELVPAGHPIRPGRIRDANGPALVARLGSAGFEERTFLGVARDDPADVRAKLASGLDADCLIVSGGVSVGEHDLVPEILEELGVEFRFTGVAMKPGRPQKFGLAAPRRGAAGGSTAPATSAGAAVVFGLPGNPVSVLVATELLVLPVLRRMAGEADPRPRPREGTLTRAVKDRRGRRSFSPAIVSEGPDGRDGPTVEPVEYHGSGDIVGFSRANAIFTLPADSAGAEAGARVEFYPRES